MEESEIDYEALPVVACKYGNNLHILNDEVENDIFETSVDDISLDYCVTPNQVYQF